MPCPRASAEAAPGLGGQPDQVVAQAGVDNAGWQIVLARAESSVGETARDAFIRELVLLGVVGALALLGAWWVARRIDRLHRAEVGHAGEIAALEKFTAALAAADSPAAVAEAVGAHGPEVLGTQRIEIARNDVHRTGDAHRQSLIATMNEQTAVALERARNSVEVEHLATLGSALSRATTTDEVIAAILDHGAVVDDVFAVRASVHDIDATPCASSIATPPAGARHRHRGPDPGGPPAGRGDPDRRPGLGGRRRRAARPVPRLGRDRHGDRRRRRRGGTVRPRVRTGAGGDGAGVRPAPTAGHPGAGAAVHGVTAGCGRVDPGAALRAGAARRRDAAGVAAARAAPADGRLAVQRHHPRRRGRDLGRGRLVRRRRPAPRRRSCCRSATSPAGARSPPA